MAVIKCPECNRYLQSNVKVCTNCGAKLHLCPKCGAVYSGDKETCEQCGYKFLPSVPAPTAPVATAPEKSDTPVQPDDLAAITAAAAAALAAVAPDKSADDIAAIAAATAAAAVSRVHAAATGEAAPLSATNDVSEESNDDGVLDDFMSEWQTPAVKSKLSKLVGAYKPLRIAGCICSLVLGLLMVIVTLAFNAYDDISWLIPIWTVALLCWIFALTPLHYYTAFSMKRFFNGREDAAEAILKYFYVTHPSYLENRNKKAKIKNLYEDQALDMAYCAKQPDDGKLLIASNVLFVLSKLIGAVCITLVVNYIISPYFTITSASDLFTSAAFMVPFVLLMSTIIISEMLVHIIDARFAKRSHAYLSSHFGNE